MESKTYDCPCGKTYNYPQNLYAHRKNCNTYLQIKHANIICKETDKISVQQCEDMQIEQLKKTIEEQEHRYKKQLIEQEQLYKSRLEEQEQHYTKLLNEQEQRYKKLLDEQEYRYKNYTPSAVQVPIVQNTTQQPLQPVTHAKPFVIKDYLKELKPISIETFMSNYIPKPEEYNNILKMGIYTGITNNFTNYLETHTKEQYPIVVSNCQNARLRIYVYTTEWIMYDVSKAHKYMSNLVIRFVNKYFKYINIFNEMYPGCVIESPSLHPDKEDHINKKTCLTHGISSIDDENASRIYNILIEHFTIPTNEDE